MFGVVAAAGLLDGVASPPLKSIVMFSPGSQYGSGVGVGHGGTGEPFRMFLIVILF